MYVCMLSTFSSISSGTTGPIIVKLDVKPPWDGRTKVCSTGPGHMTKNAVMPVYGNQRTNGPVNAHLISGPTISTKTSSAKFDIVVK